tara:strand:+ start:761 stop:1273 length:513 start_codon:yes stop_codon:yes gene_type:complete
MLSYIFAYGSLVDKESRESTLSTDLVYPCALQDHYIRFWTYHPLHQDQLVLGISEYITKGNINGVLLVVDDLMLSNLDKREHRYTRIQLSKNNLVITKQLDSDIPLYTYVLHRDRDLEVENSLENSRYMHICCRGFLHYGAEYLKQFIETTDGWKYPWIEYYVNSYKKIC